MKRPGRIMRLNVRYLGILIVLLLGATVSFAGTCEEWVAKAVSVEGNVEAKLVDEPLWQPVTLNSTFCAGDTIRVLNNSRAELSLVNQPVLRLDQNSTITLGGVKEERTFLVDMIQGAAHFFSRAPRSISVNTAFVNAGVEGTEFLVEVRSDETFISVFEGKVLASNDAGSLGIGSGQSAAAKAGQAPVARVVASPRDAVRWALYYPPVLGVSPEKITAGDSFDPVYLASRASSQLAVGRVDEANSDIDQILSIDPDNSDAMALQSIIALVQNDKAKGLTLAKKAVEADPESAPAKVALSYNQQAAFDLEGARATLENAVKQTPDNALAWARLAEIHMSFGDLGKALDAAKEAVALSQDLSRTQTVLGYAYLTQVKTEKAKKAFEKAIELDQADPLPRMGQGLAKIREGDLAEGRRDLEIAAGLDPNNSLVRSYLGKAYFEEKNDKLDGREYAAAKELDPNDPTPWFYDAIRKQTLNRPVEALQDLQKATELNDNRAVYRSKLLLDSDQAARSASLARIYRDLGFQQRALVEGYNSVNADPSNHSAHRFLADSYSALPRHEIARVSELLQSQLLQPSNITPIQPHLAESNLFLISSGGATDLSFNEFNPLFNRNRMALQASGMTAEDETWGGEGVVSGIYGRLSMSAGYSHFETDGFRKNNDQDDDIANIFAQYEINYKTSIQAEYRTRSIDTGDVQLRYFEDDYLENLREDTDTDSIRVGLRHEFTPAFSMIGNMQYQEAENKIKDTPDPIASFESKTDDDAYGGELQGLFGMKNFKLVGGAGYFSLDLEEDSTFELDLPPPPFGPGPIVDEQSTDDDVSHANVYLYAHIELLKDLNITLGGSGDFFESDSEASPDEDQFNPKLGITWKPIDGTILRAVALRVYQRTLITDQTIEPTQVAGFNQFFDDATGTDSWRYGAAIDQMFTSTLYGGIEYTQRDLDVPFSDFNPVTGDESNENSNWEEKNSRAYLVWAPHRMISLSVEWLWEKLDRDKKFADGAEDAETNYFPLGINFFHPIGFTVGFKGTYISQDGSFEEQGDIGNFKNGDDNFWLCDAVVRYRFPKRFGFISAGVSNLLDEEFEYFDSDRSNPRIQPARSWFAKITLAF